MVKITPQPKNLAVKNMHIMSTNFAKTLVWKHEYDVKLWRHKQRTQNTNYQHTPLNELPPWEISAYATVWCTSTRRIKLAKKWILLC